MAIIYKTIYILDNYRIQRDNHGWTLQSRTQGFDKKTKMPKDVWVNTYYGRLDQVCAAILDREAGNCKTVEEMMILFESAKSGLTKEVELSLKARKPKALKAE